jgi:hypothetical protein
MPAPHAAVAFNAALSVAVAPAFTVAGFAVTVTAVTVQAGGPLEPPVSVVQPALARTAIAAAATRDVVGGQQPTRAVWRRTCSSGEGIGVNYTRRMFWLPATRGSVRTEKIMKAKERDELIRVLQTRFEKNMSRHQGITWSDVQARLDAQPKALAALQAMEESGGEPDVIGRDKKSGQITFCDCAAQSPSGRRSVCYDRKARNSRKEHKPKSSALELAQAMGVELLTEEQYRRLQELGEFDTKTSSWVQTPDEVRELGGALFCDRRYDKVFVYHNGAESYYAARGFRGLLRV